MYYVEWSSRNILTRYQLFVDSPHRLWVFEPELEGDKNLSLAVLLSPCLWSRISSASVRSRLHPIQRSFEGIPIRLVQRVFEGIPIRLATN